MLFFELDALRVMRLAAAIGARNRVRAAANAILFFQKIRLFFSSVRGQDREVLVNAAFAARRAVASYPKGGDFIVGDETLCRGHFCQQRIIGSPGQGEFPKTVQNRVRMAEIKPHEIGILMVGIHKPCHLRGHLFKEIRIRQPFRESGRLIREAVAAKGFHRWEIGAAVFRKIPVHVPERL